MFRTINRLLFGGEEENPKEVKSEDVVDEGWLVVSHQETITAENQDAELSDSRPLDTAHRTDTVADMETDTSLSDAERTVPSSSTSGAVTISLSHPKVLAEVIQSACIQKATAWVDRHHVSHSSMKRQNRVRQGVQQRSFHLQQPGLRSLSH
ncbi:hypothetical protein JOB18_007751 [Solea senegalensis]|uniref:Tumor protein p53-inducible nuclear protein 2 n=1 Tax=Solea senegalensis TaxID=28829 RepID=A0AAV6QL54_SOLSE|nr:hypothetical protein JOB18_007751 [Solea senegalensis]